MEDSELLKKISREYEVARDIVFFESVKEGSLTQNSILQNESKKFFLKKYEQTFLKEVREIHSVGNFFSNSGIPVILPLITNSGENFFVYENEYYSLFPFIQARKIERDELSNKSLKSLAEMLAKIHMLSQGGDPEIIGRVQGPWNRDKFHLDLEEILKRIQKKKNKSEFDILAIKSLDIKKKIVEGNRIESKDLNLNNDCLLHGDYHERNVFFNEDGSVEYIFDLDNIKLGSRFFELARSMDFICFDGIYENENIDKAKLYLKSYSDKYPVNADELYLGMSYYFMKKAHSLWVEREHYINNNNRVDCFLNREVLMLEFYSKNLHQLSKDLF